MPRRSFHRLLKVEPSAGTRTVAHRFFRPSSSWPLTFLPSFTLCFVGAGGVGVGTTGLGGAGTVGSTGGGGTGTVGGTGVVGTGVSGIGDTQVGSSRWYQLVSPLPPSRESEMCTWLRCRRVTEHFLSVRQPELR